MDFTFDLNNNYEIPLRVADTKPLQPPPSSPPTRDHTSAGDETQDDSEIEGELGADVENHSRNADGIHTTENRFVEDSEQHLPPVGSPPTLVPICEQTPPGLWGRDLSTPDGNPSPLPGSHSSQPYDCPVEREFYFVRFNVLRVKADYQLTELRLKYAKWQHDNNKRRKPGKETHTEQVITSGADMALPDIHENVALNQPSRIYPQTYSHRSVPHGQLPHSCSHNMSRNAGPREYSSQPVHHGGNYEGSRTGGHVSPGSHVNRASPVQVSYAPPNVPPPRYNLDDMERKLREFHSHVGTPQRTGVHDANGLHGRDVSQQVHLPQHASNNRHEVGRERQSNGQGTTVVVTSMQSPPEHRTVLTEDMIARANEDVINLKLERERLINDLSDILIQQDSPEPATEEFEELKKHPSVGSESDHDDSWATDNSRASYEATMDTGTQYSFPEEEGSLSGASDDDVVDPFGSEPHRTADESNQSHPFANQQKLNKEANDTCNGSVDSFSQTVPSQANFRDNLSPSHLHQEMNYEHTTGTMEDQNETLTGGYESPTGQVSAASETLTNPPYSFSSPASNKDKHMTPFGHSDVLHEISDRKFQNFSQTSIVTDGETSFEQFQTPREHLSYQGRNNPANAVEIKNAMMTELLDNIIGMDTETSPVVSPFGDGCLFDVDVRNHKQEQSSVPLAHRTNNDEDRNASMVIKPKNMEKDKTVRHRKDYNLDVMSYLVPDLSDEYYSALEMQLEADQKEIENLIHEEEKERSGLREDTISPGSEPDSRHYESFSNGVVCSGNNSVDINYRIGDAYEESNMDHRPAITSPNRFTNEHSLTEHPSLNPEEGLDADLEQSYKPRSTPGHKDIDFVPCKIPGPTKSRIPVPNANHARGKDTGELVAGRYVGVHIHSLGNNSYQDIVDSETVPDGSGFDQSGLQITEESISNAYKSKTRANQDAVEKHWNETRDESAERSLVPVSQSYLDKFGSSGALHLSLREKKHGRSRIPIPVGQLKRSNSDVCITGTSSEELQDSDTGRTVARISPMLRCDDDVMTSTPSFGKPIKSKIPLLSPIRTNEHVMDIDPYVEHQEKPKKQRQPSKSLSPRQVRPRGNLWAYSSSEEFATTELERSQTLNPTRPKTSGKITPVGTPRGGSLRRNVRPKPSPTFKSRECAIVPLSEWHKLKEVLSSAEQSKATTPYQSKATTPYQSKATTPYHSRVTTPADMGCLSRGSSEDLGSISSSRWEAPMTSPKSSRSQSPMTSPKSPRWESPVKSPKSSRWRVDGKVPSHLKKKYAPQIGMNYDDDDIQYDDEMPQSMSSKQSANAPWVLKSESSLTSSSSSSVTRSTKTHDDKPKRYNRIPEAADTKSSVIRGAVGGHAKDVAGSSDDVRSGDDKKLDSDNVGSRADPKRQSWKRRLSLRRKKKTDSSDAETKDKGDEKRKKKRRWKWLRWLGLLKK